ncbi:MAG: hypothetical protein GY940_46010 [bacterium]|nr:hypothetical protein [bacterium]
MKKNVLCYSLFLILCCGSLSVSVMAEKVSERIQLNGFLSQGFVYTTENIFLPESGTNGSYEMNEFALTVSVDVTEKLRFGLQFLARDFGPIGNHKIELDWGFADYRFANEFGIRVGKIKTPIGFYNEIRDTDALYPVVILPQSIYDETLRPVFIAHNGLDIYGHLNFGAGGLDYHFFTGGMNHSSESPYLSDIQNSINVGIAEMGLSISPLEMDTRAFYGGRLIWKTPIRGLQLGGSLVNLKTRFNSQLTIPFVGVAPVSGSLDVKNAFLLSGRWAIGDFTVSAEYMELPALITLALTGQELEVSDNTLQGWYVMASYIFGDKLTLYSYYDQYYADKGDKEGLFSIRLGNPGYFSWQKDFVFGVRYDVNFNWTIKAEWHRVDGLGKSVRFNNPLESEQKWNMIAARLSFNF